ELSWSDSHSITDRTNDFAVAVQFEELSILTARHPWIAVRVELKRANEVSHLHRLQKFSIAAVHDDSILLAIPNPYVAVRRVNRESVHRIELSLSHTVAIPLTNELPGLIEMDDARRAKVIGGIVRICIIGTLVRVTFTNVDIAVSSKGDHH